MENMHTDERFKRSQFVLSTGSGLAKQPPYCKKKTSYKKNNFEQIQMEG